MSAIDLRTEIMHLLQNESNEGLLSRIRSELAELDAEHEKAVRGEGTSYSWDEVKRKAREALKR
jgi:hypothetical protein